VLRVSLPRRSWDAAAIAAMALAIVVVARAQDIPGPVPLVPIADASEDADAAAADDTGLFLPTSRKRERLLDRARRLMASGDWADAATLLDQIVSEGDDAFVAEGDHGGTRRSIRGEASGLIMQLPAAGRAAYELLFGGRAERSLADAIDRGDGAGVAEVARRWMATPAGHTAAIILVVQSLEAGEWRVADAWLDRLLDGAGAGRDDAMLWLMKACVQERAGDEAGSGERHDAIRQKVRGMARIGGRDVALSSDMALSDLFPPPAFSADAAESSAVHRAWLQPGGNAARQGVVAATRPLLVPRYRVPITSHPQESRLLDRRRRAAAAAGGATWPAGNALAVGDTIVVKTPLGVLGIDFETGKRLWLQSAMNPSLQDGDEGAVAALGRTFDDFTGSVLSSDGRGVFVVESHAEAVASTVPSFGRVDRGGWRGGNVLCAYDATARGQLLWRIPARSVDGPPEWFMGAPLVVGREIYVLVEAQGQMRVDVRDASTGQRLWSQHLADLDERQSSFNPDNVMRRRAGLTPSLGEGVLVCPLGGGALVAIDAATRTLLWAHTYRSRASAEAAQRGIGGPFAVDAEVDDAASQVAGEPWPVIAHGKVLVVPYDGTGVLCLGLRDGTPAWTTERRGGVQMAGVVNRSVMLIDREGIESVSIDTGRRRWVRPHPAAAVVSGRSLVTDARLFVPYDTPEVVEVETASGAIVGRHAGRGGASPGNLVAHRGEVISRGLDAVDVFHQAADLETRIETAQLDNNREPWRLVWSAQMAVDGGDVRAGLSDLLRAADAMRLPPRSLADAMAFALRRDYEAAAPVWAAWRDAGVPAAGDAAVLRGVADGSLHAGDLQAAWSACRGLLVQLAEDGAADRIIDDPSDPSLEVDADRWLSGRIEELARRLVGDAGSTMAAAIADEAEAVATVDEAARLRRLETFLGRVGSHPAAGSARAAVTNMTNRDGLASAGRHVEVWRHLMAEAGSPAPAAKTDGGEEAWPFGAVSVQRSRLAPTSVGPGGQIVVAPLAGCLDSVIDHMSVRYDMQQRKVLVHDRFGRPAIEPLSLDSDGTSGGVPWMSRIPPIEPSVVGRVLVVRSSGGVSAFDIGGVSGESRLLWRQADRSPSGRDGVTIRITAPSSGRIARNGGIPLGRRITEADDLSPSVSRLPPASAGGVLVASGRSASLLDPATGRVLWERRNLPAVAEWIGDDEVLCGCTVDGRGSPVIAIRDGRLRDVVDLPHRRQRLATSGRFVVAIDPLDASLSAARVRLVRHDPAGTDAIPLGDFSGDALATTVGSRHLGVFEPDGTFTLIDMTIGGAVWQTHLAGGPRRLELLHVLTWRDRYLVVAGGDSPVLDDDRPTLSLQGVLAASESTPAFSGAVWAVDRADGSPLWPVPATVERQSLLLSQPEDLPVLVLCRQTRGGEGGRHEMNVLCLDKRSGHAVLDDERLPVTLQMFVGCEVMGSPDAHTITVRGANGTAPPVTLEFTGNAMPPRPPYQADGRLPSVRRGVGDLGAPAADDP